MFFHQQELQYGSTPDRPDAVHALKKEFREVSYQYLNFSDGRTAAQGSWASGPTTSAPMPLPTHPDARSHGTTEIPNTVEKLAGTVQDKLKHE